MVNRLRGGNSERLKKSKLGEPSRQQSKERTGQRGRYAHETETRVSKHQPEGMTWQMRAPRASSACAQACVSCACAHDLDSA
eukprot:4712067-Pleurochrysis_carterae.AAC.4